MICAGAVARRDSIVRRLAQQFAEIKIMRRPLISCERLRRYVRSASSGPGAAAGPVLGDAAVPVVLLRGGIKPFDIRAAREIGALVAGTRSPRPKRRLGDLADGCRRGRYDCSHTA